MNPPAAVGARRGEIDALNVVPTLRDGMDGEQSR